MKTNEYFGPLPSGRPRIFAHRGFTYLDGAQRVDENTLQAFENALQAGADYLESDVRATRDRVAILFHDPTLLTRGGKRVPVSSLTFAELNDFELPFGGKIPTLHQALDRFPNAKFNLDIKTQGAIDPATDVLLGASAKKRVLVTSFSSATRIRALAKLGGSVATSASSFQVLSARVQATIGSSPSTPLNPVDAFQVPVKMFGINFANRKFIELLAGQSIETHFWTINEEAEMLRLVNMGARGIVTDRTDLAIRAFN